MNFIVYDKNNTKKAWNAPGTTRKEALEESKKYSGWFGIAPEDMEIATSEEFNKIINAR